MFGNPKSKKRPKGQKGRHNMSKKEELTSAKEANTNYQNLKAPRVVYNGDGTCTLTIRHKDWKSMTTYLMGEGEIGLGLPNPLCNLECNMTIHMDNCDMKNYGLLSVEMYTYTMGWFMSFYEGIKPMKEAEHEAIWRELKKDPDFATAWKEGAGEEVA